MKKLKIILFFSISILFILRLFTFYNYKSIYNNGNIKLEGTVISIKYTDKYMTIILNLKEKIIVRYKDKINIRIGDIILVEGSIEEPNSNTVFNLFNYKKYLLSKKIYKILNADNIRIIRNTSNYLYKIKNYIYNRLEHINNEYLYTIILADNRMDDKIYESIKNNGISHLFAISGMHISLFSYVILSLLNIFIKNKKISYIITLFILLIYMLLIGTSSIIRSALLFGIISIKKIFNLKIKSSNMMIMILYIMLFFNPYYIYDIGFLYSFVISFTLIKYNNLYNNKKYFYKLFIVSMISSLVSLPVTINNNFSFNILSPIINIVFVPFISFIFFPLSIIIFIIPKLNFIYLFVINILENASMFFNKISIIINMGCFNAYIIIVYYIVLYSLLKNIKMYKMIFFSLILIFQYNIHYFNFNDVLTMIDVKQGDSFLLELKNNVVLIDTGGLLYYDLANDTIIPYLKSLGIRRIDYLIFTHGDYDHIGSSINLIKNFKINNIFMNSGNNNDLEKEIMSLANIKNIMVKQISKYKLNINNNILYFLNNRNLEENKDSLIIYADIDNKGLLFMGDSTKDEEYQLLDNYNLKVDILKVGHHGSNTSTSERLINELKPKYALISVGLNNKFNHPSKETIDSLKKSKIYRTDIDGSVRITFNKSKNKIIVRPP